MNTTYQYVVLRLAVDQVRGEVINVGVVLFQTEEAPRVVTMATLNKLRAIDSTWSSARLTRWVQNVETILASNSGVSNQIATLERFGFCEQSAVGMFAAADPQQLAAKLLELKAAYVANKGHEPDVRKRIKRTRLQTAMREQFRRMHVLGSEVGHIADHLVVANVPVPGYDELKSDFVYKNGVYRITQTMDYNVAPDSLHNKLAEACVKSTAADLAAKAYGVDTLRLAVVDVPNEFADAADSHIDLLLAHGFEVFHFSDHVSMDQYFQKATPPVLMLG